MYNSYQVLRRILINVIYMNTKQNLDIGFKTEGAENKTRELDLLPVYDSELVYMFQRDLITF